LLNAQNSEKNQDLIMQIGENEHKF